MNEITHPNHLSNAPELTGDHRIWTPNTEKLTDIDKDKAAPEAIGLMKQAVQGAHATIDRLAEGAAPAVHQLGEAVSSAEDALHAKADQLRMTRDEWAEGARTTVRGNPLVSVAAAFALGVLVTRISR